ncbi:MAG: aliphatic sulfonate ABC transporter substrate-binding protein [Thermodesulfobacteriota bacterium]
MNQNKSWRQKVFPWAALLIGLIFLVPAASPAWAQAKPEKITVVYGGATWLGHYPVWVGMEKGIFQKKGLGVLWQGFTASSGRMGALISGDLDFATTGSISAIALMASGAKGFFALAAPDSYATVEGIIAKSDIKTINDLKGKKIAVTFASSAHVLVLDLLEKAGLSPDKDVSLINLQVTEMPAAFKGGEVQACALWTPNFNVIKAMEGAHVLADDTQFSLYKQFGLGPGPDVLTVRKEFAEKYPITCQAFLEGYFEALALLGKDPNACAQVLMKLTNLKPEEQMSVLKDITWHPKEKQKEMMVNPGTFVQGLQKLADMLVKHKQIDKAPQIKDWVNTSLLP